MRKRSLIPETKKPPGKVVFSKVQ